MRLHHLLLFGIAASPNDDGDWPIVSAHFANAIRMRSEDLRERVVANATFAMRLLRRSWFLCALIVLHLTLRFSPAPRFSWCG
jgi:hypothetical protein